MELQNLVAWLTAMKSFAAVARRTLLTPLAALLPLAALPPLPLLAADPPPDPSKGVQSGSGLKFIDFRKGAGETPRFGQLIRFHYVAYALAEQQGELNAFDSSYDRNAPYFTKHGNGFTCQGLEEALHSMRPGGRRRVILPPVLGFTGDKGPLPPGPRQRDALFGAIEKQQPLIYDLELLSVVDDLLDRGDYDDLDLEEAQKFAREVSKPPDAEDLAAGPMGKGL